MAISTEAVVDTTKERSASGSMPAPSSPAQEQIQEPAAKPKEDPTVVRLQAARLDADRRLAAVKARRGEKDAVVTTAESCLHKAKANETAENYYVAWDCIHQFDHELLAALDDDERTTRWVSLVAEAAEKLKGWRTKASEALIKQVGDKKPVPLHAIQEMHSHLWAAAQNQHHKIEVYRTQTLPLLRRLLLGVVAAALLFSYFTAIANPSASLLLWAEAVFLGVAAGMLGGILSMTFSLGRVDASKKIPEARLGALMTSIRPLLGGAVAIPVVVFVKANFVQVQGFEGPLAILAFCFLAGFSERWFVGLIEKFEDKK